MQSDNDIVGRGFEFPFKPSSGNLAELSTGAGRIIDQSIAVILGTQPGERVMRPDFGCEMWRHVFAPLDLATLGSIEDAVATALGRWEPRIDVIRVEATFDDRNQALAHIVIDYRIRVSNDERNLVHPFYVIPGDG